jgi:putative Ca2+/H+ antiporter (TMEM165/GDT1 family)
VRACGRFDKGRHASEEESVSAFLVSFGIIFVAELGDKSQLVALWFSRRYRWWLVLTGVALATLVVHLGSVAIGRIFGELLPERPVLVVVGLSFFGFAIWSLRGDRLEERESRQGLSLLGSLGLICASFFLSELGDKTQLATVSLAGERPEAVAVWLGSTGGMVVADGLAIGAGLIAGKRLPDRLLGQIAAILFFGFGLFMLVRALT